MSGTCIIAACDVEVGRGQRMCKPHWQQVPGALRSKISLGPQSRGRIMEELWAAAVSEVGAP